MYNIICFCHQILARDVINAIEKSSLETLNLQGNTLGVDASKAISEALKNKPTLKVGIVFIYTLINRFIHALFY